MPLSLGIASGAGFLKNPAEPAALGYRVNYIDNPSFEVDTAGWNQFGSATIARSTGESFIGSASLSVTATTTSAGAQRGTTGVGNMIPLVGGPGTYYISAYVKLANGTAPGTYLLRYLQYEEETSSSTVAAGNVGSQSLSYTGNWVRLSGSFTKNSSANFAIIRVSTATASVGEIFYIDSVMLEKSDTLESYFDGGSNGFWSGSANASFSGATPY
jgi:hypothetical protein